MTTEIAIGSRVRLTALGAKDCPSLAMKLGSVVGGSVYRNSVSVRFDGNKSSITLHRSYLEVISLHDRESGTISNPPSNVSGTNK
jgi:hypothetical protein